MNLPIQNELITPFIGDTVFDALSVFLENPRWQHSKLFILADENTLEKCVPALVSAVSALQTAEIIEVESGEATKCLEVCAQLWQTLSEFGADRHSLLINVGGGVVTDLGGFVSAIYMRGIPFIHIPTSLLGMVDACIGAKVGVDLANTKNLLGTFANPEAIFMGTEFLNTLPQRELMCGFAEMLKHGMILDRNYFFQLITQDFPLDNVAAELIQKSIALKQDVVRADPYDKGVRKLLNFGHTLGHAFESVALNNSLDVPHGEAIAAGMLCEAHLSMQTQYLPLEDLEQIRNAILNLYNRIPLHNLNRGELMHYMLKDKKNEAGQIRFVLLTKIGHGKTDCLCTEEQINKALDYYLSEYDKLTFN